MPFDFRLRRSAKQYSVSTSSSPPEEEFVRRNADALEITNLVNESHHLLDTRKLSDLVEFVFAAEIDGLTLEADFGSLVGVALKLSKMVSAKICLGSRLRDMW